MEGIPCMIGAFVLLIYAIHIMGVGCAVTCSSEEYYIDGQCCPLCSAGSHVSRRCTQDSGTSCVPCPEGTYLDTPNGRTNCLACHNCSAGPGLKVQSPCTPTSNTVCEPSDGFYCVFHTKKNGCFKTRKHRSCKPGQYIFIRGTSSTDSKCDNCTGDTYSDGTFTTCQPHTDCESIGLQLIKPGNHSSDSTCGETQTSHDSQTSRIFGVAAGLFAGVVAGVVVGGVSVEVISALVNVVHGVSVVVGIVGFVVGVVGLGVCAHDVVSSVVSGVVIGVSVGGGLGDVGVDYLVLGFLGFFGVGLAGIVDFLVSVGGFSLYACNVVAYAVVAVVSPCVGCIVSVFVRFVLYVNTHVLHAFVPAVVLAIQPVCVVVGKLFGVFRCCVEVLLYVVFRVLHAVLSDSDVVSFRHVLAGSLKVATFFSFVIYVCSGGVVHILYFIAAAVVFYVVAIVVVVLVGYLLSSLFSLTLDNNLVYVSCIVFLNVGVAVMYVYVHCVVYSGGLYGLVVVGGGVVGMAIMLCINKAFLDEWCKKQIARRRRID